MLHHIGGADLITILHSRPSAPQDLWTATRRRFRAELVGLAETTSLAGCAGRVIVVDSDLDDPDTVARLRGVLRSVPEKALLFVMEKSDRGQYVQACALGADHVLARPLTGAYLEVIDSLLHIGDRAAAVEGGVRAGLDTLRTVFALADGRAGVSAETVAQSAGELVAAVGEAGLHRWVEAVHRHHNATYQHCLLVTGTAVAFGQQLGFRRRDIDRLLVGAMVHDLGKVAIPLEILEKPAPLTHAEFAQMKTHAAIGRRMLEENGGFEQETIDVVARHHEYLDGSGYPDGLTAPSLSDLVRVITIADIFSALSERRAYRAPVPPGEAYEVLRSMRGRLDMALVRAFEPITRDVGKAA